MNITPFLFRIDCKIGSKYAAVFPDPVFARAGNSQKIGFKERCKTSTYPKRLSLPRLVGLLLPESMLASWTSPGSELATIGDPDAGSRNSAGGVLSLQYLPWMGHCSHPACASWLKSWAQWSTKLLGLREGPFRSFQTPWIVCARCCLLVLHCLVSARLNDPTNNLPLANYSTSFSRCPLPYLWNTWTRRIWLIGFGVILLLIQHQHLIFSFPITKRWSDTENHAARSRRRACWQRITCCYSTFLHLYRANLKQFL